MKRFWVDVGGTFTDCIGVTDAGRLVSHKLLSSAVYIATVRDVGDDGILLSDVVAPENYFTDYAVRIIRCNGAGEPSLMCQGKVLAFTAKTSFLRLDFAGVAAAAAAIQPGDRCELASPEEAPVAGIRWLLGLTPNDPVGAIELRLGTTKGTNALLERTGCDTIFVTTKGFADLLEIGTQDRPRLFDLNIRKFERLYKAVVEADERISSTGEVLQPLDIDGLRHSLEPYRRERAKWSLAICLLNSYKNPVHEAAIAEIAREFGFRHASVSSDLAPLQKIVPRAETTVIDAYLTPVVKDYLAGIQASLPLATIKLMASSGSLHSPQTFHGKDIVLSGPAGGVVAVGAISRRAHIKDVIGFDMGGTSTDVCRFSGEFERRLAMDLKDPNTEATLRISAPMFAIETVAAGGGSICWFDGVQLRVGPESARSHPGPACYGNGGPLTITDLNVYTGRISAAHFSFKLVPDAVTVRLVELQRKIVEACAVHYELATLAGGFLEIANQTMASAIKTISIAQGYDVKEYALLCYGGAGAQHAGAIAKCLDMTRIVHPPLASHFSAFGVGLARIRKFASADVGATLSRLALENLRPDLDSMRDKLTSAMLADGCLDLSAPVVTAELRYRGQGTGIEVALVNLPAMVRDFEVRHTAQYGFSFPDRPVEIRSVHMFVEAREAHDELGEEIPIASAVCAPNSLATWYGDAWLSSKVVARASLGTACVVRGPAVIVEPTSSIVVEPGWEATVDGAGNVVQVCLDRPSRSSVMSQAEDPIRLSLFHNAFQAIAVQMGTDLQRTALSVNVKERLDFSCALFSADGDLIVNAPHIPVHLGSMSDTVKFVLRNVADLRQGDVIVTNDPYCGGSHLPDVTVIMPVFAEGTGEVIFLTANRAHHAEIGGITPGSMPAFSRNLAQEGVVIAPQYLVRDGRFREDEIRHLLTHGSCHPSRDADANIADLKAQAAACATGKRLLRELVGQYSLPVVHAYMAHIQNAARRKIEAALEKIVPGIYEHADCLDDGTPICVAITVRHAGGGHEAPSAIVDFTGSGAVHPGNFNANPSIVRAAVLYCFRCLINEDIPLNQGVFAPIELRIPPDCILDPLPSVWRSGEESKGDKPAVAAGNVETSQRIVDVILGALGLAAASQGTMNNLIFGAESGASDFPVGSYYETICGGAGAGPGFTGTSAVHTHMTNTRITDPEVLEERFPVRLRRFAIRRGSGGVGEYGGGDGVIRELEFLEPVTVSLVTSRRRTAPFGLSGGAPGLPGRNLLVRAQSLDSPEELAPTASLDFRSGDRIIIETPGGGGFGAVPRVGP